jgi:hypothetical protein
MNKKNKSGAGRPPDWTRERIALLRKHYPNKPNEEVATLLKTSVTSVRNAAMKYKVKKANRYWDKPEEDFLLKNWQVMSAVELAEKLHKTKWAVINKYRELTGLR